MAFKIVGELKDTYLPLIADNLSVFWNSHKKGFLFL